MSKLDWSRITDKVAVWCKAEEEARAFLLAAEEAEKWWSAGRVKPTERTSWDAFSKETCYNVDSNCIGFCDRRWYKDEGYTIIPCADLLLPEKPFLCERLGVDVDERFEVTSMPGVKFWVCDDGTFSTIPAAVSGSSVAFLRAVEHTDRILRQPRFTEDEVAAMRVLYAAGVRFLCRGSDGRFVDQLPEKLFPSILPGQSVAIQDVIGRDTP